MPGRLVHFELPAQDTARARSFYSDLFGWRFQDFEGPVEYHMLEGVEPGGAIYPSQGGEHGPIVYFDTDDIDETLARASELGGRAEEKQPIPSVGWFARCWDTEGNPFSLFQSDESVQP
ncbi:MAG: VOC family protein [Actinomycetota bacterium]|jgi:predicted enzyme related to lactoylglutathione lyase|nr:VOC family protein [Actinomycetota bacterium]